SPSGFLFFARDATLFAQAFDFKKLELVGNPVGIASAPAGWTTAASTALDFVTYRMAAAGIRSRLTWLDRDGRTIGTVGGIEPNGLDGVELSPDGKRIAVAKYANDNADIWLIDAERGATTRLTFDPHIDDHAV